MSQRGSNRVLAAVAVVIFQLSAWAAPAAADWIGQYFNTIVGTYWVYENVDQPEFTWWDSIFEAVVYEGHPAVRIGSGLDDHSVVQNDGQVITIYAQTEEGVLVDFPEDVTVGEFEDGSMMSFCPFGGDCDSLMIRVWTEIDPSLRSIYGMDPGLTDLILLVSYDGAFTKNLHNTALESNMPPGLLPPTGAVVRVEWYQRKIGMYAETDIDPTSGGFVEYWRLIDYASAVPDDLPAPAVARLAQNSPNPFNPLTVIGFELGEDVPVRLRVFDLAGRHVATLADGWQPGIGAHSLSWAGRDLHGRGAPSGVYVYRLEAGEQSVARSMVLVR